jgi:hypothetical protein
MSKDVGICGYFWRPKGVHEESTLKHCHRQWQKPHKSLRLISGRIKMYLQNASLKKIG